MTKEEAIKTLPEKWVEMKKLQREGMMDKDPDIFPKVAKLKKGGWGVKFCKNKAIADAQRAAAECGGKDRNYIEAAFFGWEE